VNSLSGIRTLLKAAARPKDVAILQRFFKTGKGEYGEGDVFIGVKVPDIRKVVAQSDGLTFDKVVLSLHSKIHEERLLALLIMVRRYQRAKDDKTKKEIVDVYLRERAFINNWDLVDGSARDILGPWLISRSRAILRGSLSPEACGIGGSLYSRRSRSYAKTIFQPHSNSQNVSSTIRTT
jgi:hypothetical protein